MRFTGFDSSFWIGAGALVSVILVSVAVANFFEIHVLWFLFGAAPVVWFIMGSLENRILTRIDDGSALFCQWASRINETDFALDDQLTIVGLSELGLTPEVAVGRQFVFHAEAGPHGDDIHFEGQVLQNETGEIIIRANDVSDLRRNTSQ